MIDENNISSIQSDFERIKKRDAKGLVYWTSRELCTALGIVHTKNSIVF